MKHTYTILKEGKNTSILHGLHSNIRNLLMDEYINGNIKTITIKDGGTSDEKVLVTLKNTTKNFLTVKDKQGFIKNKFSITYSNNKWVICYNDENLSIKDS